MMLWDLTRFQHIKGDIDRRMQYRGEDHQVKHHIPVFFIIGDNKGHAKWVLLFL